MIDAKYKAKIKTIDELLAAIGPRPRKRKVIMCHGTFDVVHPGHIRHLMYAADRADVLIASVTGDEHIKKANFRPFVPQQLRALNLAALDMVDYVIIDRNAKPLENLGKVQPDYFAKGYEYVSSGMPRETPEEKEVLDSYGGEIIFTPGDIVYSSSKLIEASPPNLAHEKLVSLLEAEELTFDHLRRALDGFASIDVHVVGDTIVDCLHPDRDDRRPDQDADHVGALRGPGGLRRRRRRRRQAPQGGRRQRHLLHRARRRQVGEFVLQDLQKAGVETEAIIDPTRPTTNKNAIVCGGYRLLKVDTLDNRTISDRIQAQLINQIGSIKAQCVMFCDFRHGIFNRETIPRFTAAIPAKVFRVADSQVASRWGNICDFQGFDLITPNEREARFRAGRPGQRRAAAGAEALRARQLPQPDPQARRARPHRLPQARDHRGPALVLRGRHLRRARGRSGRRRRRAALLCDARAHLHRQRGGRRRARRHGRGHHLRAGRQRAGRPRGRAGQDRPGRAARHLPGLIGGFSGWRWIGRDIPSPLGEKVPRRGG